MPIPRKDIDKMLEHWAEHGARVETRNDGALVFPPNGARAKPVHYTISDGYGASQNLRSWGRRNGLPWYAEHNPKPNSRALTEQDHPMTAEPVTAPVRVAEPEPFLDLVPPGARNSRPPVRTRAQQFLASLDGLGDTFWTADAIRAAAVNGVAAMSASGANARAQQLLYALGFRVVEAVRNRNGYVYRWRHDPEAPVVLATVPEHVEAKLLKGGASNGRRARQEAAERGRGAVLTPVPGPAPEPEPAPEPDAAEAEPAPTAEHAAASRDLDWALAELVRLETELAAARDDAARARAEAPADGSWVVPADDPETPVGALVKAARLYGVELEVRARRAR